MVVLASTVVLALVALQAAPSALVSPPTAQARTRSRQIDGARETTLALPHTLREGETAWLLVTVGAIGRDQIQIMTQDGQPLGTISAFGIRSGKAGGTYTVPVPAEAIRDGRLGLRLSVIQSGRAPRAPTAKEVKSLRLLIRQFKDGR
ncbi:MAG TPA: hypothetical protein VMU57_15955 [Edaphobacter sp.]|uniref:hypothetical protein n=1 Tax=Edaphobacter sp. TaxID=1934404 RepID=UPI002D0FD62A|nr:hypothetical protein [Edaphobacter sp.]HUZ96398.1 hypothetical protein [Edaphobacter sp.]